MTVSLGSNLPAIAQDNLAQAQKIVTQTVQSLSTGKRINGAQDDPATLAISQGLVSQINAINQTLLNLSNGTNLLQVADSNLSNMQNMLLQMQQLSAQGQDATLSSSQLSGIAKQMVGLYSSMTQMASSAQFNGQSLFVGNGQYDAAQSTLKLNQTNVGNLDTTVMSSIVSKDANAGTYTFSSQGRFLTLSKIDNAGNVLASQMQTLQDFRTKSGDSYQMLNFDKLGIQITLKTTPNGILGAADEAAIVGTNLSNLYHPIVIDNGPAITIADNLATGNNFLSYQPQNVVSLTGGDTTTSNGNQTLINSSNPALVTGVTSSATGLGGYMVGVQSFATQTSFNLTGFTSANDLVGVTSGFTFKVGSNTYGADGSKTDGNGNVTINAARVLSTNTTVGQFVNWVNNLYDNVSASLNQSGGNLQIEVKGSLTGADNAVSFANMQMITSKDIHTGVIDTGTVNLAADGIITNSEWSLPVKENPTITNGTEAVTYSTANYSGYGTSLSNGVLNTDVPFNASWGAPVNDLTRYLSFAVTNIVPASAGAATAFHVAGYSASNSNAGVMNNFSLTVGANTYYANGTQVVGGVSTYDPNRALSTNATVSDLSNWINNVGTTTHLAQVTGVSTSNSFVQGTYSNVSLVSDSGSGTGATANIVVGASGQITSFAINSVGSGYAIGNQLSLGNGWGGQGANNGFTVNVSSLVGSHDGVSASVQTSGGHAELVVQGTQSGTSHAVTFSNLNLITSTDNTGGSAHYNAVSLASDGLQRNGEWNVALYETVGNPTLLYSVTPAFYGAASQSSQGSIISNGDLNTNIPFAAAWGAPTNNLNRFLTFALTGVNVAQNASMTLNGRSISSDSNVVADNTSGITFYLDPTGESIGLPRTAQLTAVKAPIAQSVSSSATGMRNLGIAMTQTVNGMSSNDSSQSWNSFFQNLSASVSQAVDYLSSKRSEVGSQMNQIAYALSNSQAYGTNMQNANSALTDMNYGSQTGNLAKALVTEEAAAKMQVAANNFPTVMKTLMQQWGLIKTR